ncbi:MAG: protein kinase [Deltaproteobacteria bacterium]|nr:protein kinase [Deltaproteobacteria bacterium]
MKRFGKYQLGERLAYGGMAEVFLATIEGEAGFSKPVVIKRLHPRLSRDGEFVKMLIDEARITAQLSQSNICQVLDLGSVDGSYYIAMEYIAGEDLQTIADRFQYLGRRLPDEAIVFVIGEVLAGLDYAHAKAGGDGRPLGIIHRDISPQNVLVSYDGDVKVIDFGIAKAQTRMVQTEAGVIKGKFRYMSPEQAAGSGVDHRTDIFAAGIVLYELLRGSPHMTGLPDTEVLRRMREADIEPLSRTRPTISPELARIVGRATARHAHDRYQTAGEFRDALATYMRDIGATFGRSRLATLMRETFSDARRQHRSIHPESAPAIGSDVAERINPTELAVAADAETEVPPESTLSRDVLSGIPVRRGSTELVDGHSLAAPMDTEEESTIPPRELAARLHEPSVPRELTPVKRTDSASFIDSSDLPAEQHEVDGHEPLTYEMSVRELIGETAPDGRPVQPVVDEARSTNRQHRPAYVAPDFVPRPAALNSVDSEDEIETDVADAEGRPTRIATNAVQPRQPAAPHVPADPLKAPSVALPELPGHVRRAARGGPELLPVDTSTTQRDPPPAMAAAATRTPPLAERSGRGTFDPPAGFVPPPLVAAPLAASAGEMSISRERPPVRSGRSGWRGVFVFLLVIVVLAGAGYAVHYFGLADLRSFLSSSPPAAVDAGAVADAGKSALPERSSSERRRRKRARPRAVIDEVDKTLGLRTPAQVAARSKPSSKSRGDDVAAEIDATFGLQAKQQAALASEKGTLLVSGPGKRGVYIEGKLYGHTPRVTLKLPPGTYHVRVWRPLDGTDRRERTVKIEPGKRTTVHFTEDLVP